MTEKERTRQLEKVIELFWDRCHGVYDSMLIDKDMFIALAYANWDNLSETEKEEVINL